MIREIEATGKTVELAYQAGCAQLGVQADDENVSYEIIDMPGKKMFGLVSVPAKVKVTVTLPDAEPAVEEAAPVVAAPAEETAPVAEEQPAAAPAAEETPAAPAVEETADEEEVEIVIEEDAKVKAAVDYLREVMACMGVAEPQFSAVRKGEATIIRVAGDDLGVLIGRRGETMESLSYLASLVANRLEGDYIKLGLDVAGYRGKREQDLTALARRIGNKVKKSGRSFAMEPMNPYERRIIHSAIGAMEGLRSESKGEGKDRRVVIYSTAPDAQNEKPETERRSRGDRKGGRGGSRNDRGGRGGKREGGRSERSDRGSRNERGGRGGKRDGGRGGDRRSSVPERSYVSRDADSAAPVAPKRTERVDDFADLGFGKIEL